MLKIENHILINFYKIRMQGWQINIPVLGLTSSGKSTLLNGLFGIPVNETSRLRTTFHPVKFILDPEEKKMDVKEISAKIVENNQKPVADEMLSFRIPKPDYMSELPKRINYTFIDYPGLDDQSRSSEFNEFLTKNFRLYDIILVLIDGNSAMNTKSECDFVENIVNLVKKERSGYHTKVIFCITKIDDPDEEETKKMVQQAKTKIAEIAGEIPHRIILCSPLKILMFRYFETHKTYAGFSDDMIRKITTELIGKPRIDFSDPDQKLELIKTLDSTKISLKQELKNAGFYELAIAMNMEQSEIQPLIKQKMIDKINTGNWEFVKYSEYKNFYESTFEEEFKYLHKCLEKFAICPIIGPVIDSKTEKTKFQFNPIAIDVKKILELHNIKISDHVTDSHKNMANCVLKHYQTESAAISEIVLAIREMFGFNPEIPYTDPKYHILFDKKAKSVTEAWEKLISDFTKKATMGTGTPYIIWKNKSNPTWESYKIMIKLGEKEKAKQLIMKELETRYELLLNCMFSATQNRDNYFILDNEITLDNGNLLLRKMIDQIYKFWEKRDKTEELYDWEVYEYKIVQLAFALNEFTYNKFDNYGSFTGFKKEKFENVYSYISMDFTELEKLLASISSEPVVEEE